MIVETKFIKEITVTDPDSNLPVEIAIFKDMESNGFFGVDSSYLSNTDKPVHSPFNKETIYDVVDSDMRTGAVAPTAAAGCSAGGAK